MENRNIIMILVVIIVILAVIAGVMFMQQGHAKEPTKIKIASDKEQNEGGKLKIQLTDTNKTALSKEIVNITITDSKGKAVVDDVVKTDSKGKATLDLHLKKGKYTVNAAYGGNDNYTASNATQKLKISAKDKAKKSSSSSDTIKVELPEFDTTVKKTVGDYTVEAKKWRGTSVGGFGVWLYKNGQLVNKDSYLSRAYFYMDGEWKWSEWGNGQGANYHKYPVSEGVKIQEVEVKF